jgi:hypothetical protein
MLDTVHGDMSNVVFYNMEEYREVGETRWMTKLAKDHNLKAIRTIGYIEKKGL